MPKRGVAGLENAEGERFQRLFNTVSEENLLPSACWVEFQTSLEGRKKELLVQYGKRWEREPNRNVPLCFRVLLLASWSDTPTGVTGV